MNWKQKLTKQTVFGKISFSVPFSLWGSCIHCTQFYLVFKSVFSGLQKFPVQADICLFQVLLWVGCGTVIPHTAVTRTPDERQTLAPFRVCTATAQNQYRWREGCVCCESLRTSKTPILKTHIFWAIRWQALICSHLGQNCMKSPWNSARSSVGLRDSYCRGRDMIQT
jgi:hypothetical protein